MAIYHIEPVEGFLHGSFSRDYPPVLTIDPGDTVRYRTFDAGWHLHPFVSEEEERSCKFSPRVEGRDDGHALCGPIAIRGAQPGMVLEIHINEVRPDVWGWTIGGCAPGERSDRLGVTGECELLNWTLDPDTMTGKNQYGLTLPLRPFMGVMGMPPAEPGVHSTIPPRVCGGNMDCKELVAGSTLYLPIMVADALFSVGDGHALQGDGEVSGVAIESPMERVDLSFQLRDDMHITTPRAHTPAGWVTLAFHENLHEASLMALNAMLDIMYELYTIPRPQALALASLIVDLRVTQIVNGGMHGVHALMPHDIL